MSDAGWPADLGASHLDRALHLILVCGVLALMFGLGLIAALALDIKCLV